MWLENKTEGHGTLSLITSIWLNLNFNKGLSSRSVCVKLPINMYAACG